MSLKPLIAAALAVLALVACRSESPVEFPPLSFVRYQPIHMDVSNIEIVEEYKSPQREPHVEHLMPYSPAEAVRLWVKDRLRAVGMEKTLQVIIREGSVVSVPIRKDTAVGDLVTLNRDKRYDAKLEVELRVYGTQSAISESNVSVSATRSITIPEKASANRREAMMRQMITDLMETVNAELEKNMHLYMSGNIAYTKMP